MTSPVVGHRLYVVFTVLLWGAALPGVLVVDAGDGMRLRGVPHLAVGLVLAAVGTVLIEVGAAHLARSGVGPWGVRPGRRLVTDGPYGVVRNPVDLGATLLACAAWATLAVDLMWVVPVAALTTFVVASGPYEDRLLLEEFGDDFRAYAATVRKWLPRR